jgi:spore coat polysaccharide biosynthesis predicted glycosyltransferase SpsG
MGIKEFRFQNWDGFEMLVKEIKNWNPRGCKSEKDYEESLYKKLHSVLGDINIKKQYPIKEYKIDLMVDDRFLIEMKYNFKTKGESQRLYGQLINYMNYTNVSGLLSSQPIIVLICGECEPSMKKDLKKYCNKESITLMFKK